MKALPKPAALAALALALYDAEAKAAKVAGTLAASPVLSPVAATAALAEKFGGGTDRVASPVARVYYRENGSRNPLPLSADATAATIRRAIRDRRDRPGYDDGSGFSADGNASLGRWETLAASAASALGRRVSVAEAKRLYSEATKGAESYIGRGTKVAAPSTR